MKKALFIVLAILVMVNLAAAQQDSSVAPTPKIKGTTTTYNVDGAFGHVSHGCMLCHAPHSANATISSAAATFANTKASNTFNAAQYPTGYGGPNPITSIVTGFSGGPVAGSIYLWGQALTAQTYTTWEGTQISSAGVTKTSAVVHTLLCMGCHDNANSSYLMSGGYGTNPANGTTYLGVTNPVTTGFGDHIGLSQVNATGTGWNNLSTLANSHPVDVQYRAGNQGQYGVYWNINGDGTFVDKTFNLDGTHTGHPAKLWVDGVTGNPMVECTTCHDPHRETEFAYWNGTGYTVGTANSTVFYVRGPYGDSASRGGNTAPNGITNANFCRSCHEDKSESYANAGGALN